MLVRKKNIITLLFFWLLCTISSKGQLFDSTTVLNTTYGSALNWVDIDDDGDLDLSISGQTQFLQPGRGELYINSGGTLTYKMDLADLVEGDMKWCDFDNDGDLDLLYAGLNDDFPSEVMTIGIYWLDSIDASDDLFFTDTSMGFEPVSRASVDWGDFDNDGDHDILIAGKDGNGDIITTLYKNTNGSFTDADAGLHGIHYGKAGFIDYDLDGDLDILLSGKDNNSNKYTRLWQNNQGEYSITSDQFINLENCYFDWGDINDDRYPDLLLGGDDGNNNRSEIYINNNGISFSLSDTILPGTTYGSSGFGDVDNDGDLDVFISGDKRDDSMEKKLVFLNNETDSMIPDDFEIQYIYLSRFQFGDYDGDKDLDLIVNGRRTNNQGITILSENLSSTTNESPDQPANPKSTVEGTSVLLSWDSASDDSTSSNALTYNIYIGSSSNGVDIVSPHSNITNGKRLLSGKGYIQDTSWIIKNLSPGTYYWGVQSIDNSFVPSTFSVEDSFEIKNRNTEISFNESPNVTYPATYFDCDHDNDYDLFLSNSSQFLAAENSDTTFNKDDYKTININGYDLIKTIVPNDFNNNNQLDFSVSGNHASNNLLDSSITLFGYTSDFNFSIVDSSLVKNVDFDFVLWEDLNNDGLQDLITSGITTNLATDKPVTYIFKNMGNGSFSQVTHSIQGFKECGAVTADFDNDMDNDIIIYGKDTADIPNTFLYINNGDFSFEEQEVTGNALFRSNHPYNVLPGDFDLNGELDIYIAGEDNFENHYARVLLNNNSEFTDANLSIQSWTKMSNFWGDYDYDGDLDIFSMSYGGTDDIIKLYLNSNSSLSELEFDLGTPNYLVMPFMAANLDSVNGLDFLVKYATNDYKQFYDNWGSNSRLSKAPTNLNYEMDSLDVVLSWDKLEDCPGCTYNIRVGSHPDSVNIMSPMADLTTGFRYVIQPGNVYMNSGWRLKGLAVDTFYWSVQAIDLANTGGPWAPIDTFVVTTINADFSFNIVCQGDTTQFIDLSAASDSVVGWLWDFSDGTTSTEQNPKHAFATADTFMVKLTAYSALGDSSIKIDSVMVKQTPTADFTSTVVCQGTNTPFSNNSVTTDLTVSSWTWNFGDGDSNTDENPGTHGYINPGDYEVILEVLASNGCSDNTSKTVTVAEKPNPSISTPPDELNFCNGDSAELHVDYNPQFTYQWQSYGTNIPNADSNVYFAKVSGKYTVEVTNPLGSCTISSDTSEVIVNDLPGSPAILTQGNDTICTGDSIVLSVNAVSDYLYIWKQGPDIVKEDTSAYTVRNEGLYYLEIIDTTNGCKSTSNDSIFVKEYPLPNVPNLSKEGPSEFCTGIQTELSIGDMPGHTYQWIKDGSYVADSTRNIFIVSETGMYSLEVTNTEGCINYTNEEEIKVNNKPSSPAITVSGDSTFCRGDSTILSVPTNTDYLYIWKNGPGFVADDTNIYVAKEEGIYNLEVIDKASGCISYSNDTVLILVNDPPIVNGLNIFGDNVFCEGGGTELHIDDVPDHTYQWRKDGSNVADSTNNSFFVTKSGTYSVEVTNLLGCSAISFEEDIIVHSNPDTLAIIVTGDSVFCMGDSAVLSAAYNSKYIYQWWRLDPSPGLVEENINFVARFTGKYGLRVIDTSTFSNCSSISKDTAVIVARNLPLIDNFDTPNGRRFCKGDSVLLSVPGNINYSYQWRKDTSNIKNATSNEYYAKKSGFYSVKATSVDGCSKTSNYEKITAKNTPIAPNINLFGDTVFCSGDSLVLAVYNNANYVYEWRRNEFTEGETNIHIAKLEGSYDVIVTDTNTECSSKSINQVNVNVNTLPDKPLLTIFGSDSICSGDSTVLDILNPVSEFQYQWLNDNKLIANATENNYIVKASGNFAVVVTGDGSCRNQSEIIPISVYSVPPKPIIDVDSAISYVCPGGEMELSVDQSSSQYKYQWKRNGVELDIGRESTLKGNLEKGDYVVVAGVGNCISESDIHTIDYKDAPEKPEIEVFGPVLWYLACSNNSADIYRWYYNGVLLPEEDEWVIVANQNLGTYYVEINDGGECFVASDPVSIPEGTTGIDENIAGERKIFPNPNTGEFVFYMNNQLTGSILVEISNSSGQLIYKKLIDKNYQVLSTRINLKEFGKGIFIFSWKHEDVTESYRIIIE